MKKFHLLIILMIAFGYTSAQNYNVTVTVKSQNADLSNLKTKMSKTLSALFTELNRAYANSSDPILSGMALSADAIHDIKSIWATSHICPASNTIYVQALNFHSSDNGQVQVRGIPAIFCPVSGGTREKQEIVCNFNTSGTLISFNIAIAQNQYYDIIKAGINETETARRAMIVQYVEQFRTAYEKKDIDFLETIFSDDALIITGRKIIRQSGDGRWETIIEQTSKTKKEYLTALLKIFNKKNVRITLKFDDIQIFRHPNKKLPQWYGVRLIQTWSATDGYHDKGDLFLLWDFSDERRPIIHVRAWSPINSNINWFDEVEIKF